MFRRTKENKSKLEHKLYLAREAPEPIFDLSDCNLRHVPQGIYSLCRVFLKEVLRLDRNCLSSLAGGGQLKDLLQLQVLDLHENAFTNLPEEIGVLRSLRELYLNDNQLKKLPDAICNLHNLNVLNVARNSLKTLPENVGNLKNLKFLSVCGNKHLKRLPKSICDARKLVTLEADPEGFVYPPSDVMGQGTEAIMRFICTDLGQPYLGPETTDDIPDTNIDNNEDQTDAFEAKIWKLENIKKQKLQDFLEMEKANELMQRQEFELASAQKINKEKLLADIAEQQNKLDSELLKLQQEKELERFHLIEKVLEAEQNSDRAIQQLFELNNEPLAQLLQQEKEEEERLLAAADKYNNALRKNDILTDMQVLLEQELTKFQQFHQNRMEVSRGILEQETDYDCRIAEILQSQDLHKAELLVKLQEDSELQKAAVGTLLQRGDARCWGLLQQVRLVESQLAALTHIELDKKKLEMEENLNDLSEKRIQLSCLLMDLLDQQKERRDQLLSTLQNLEEFNNSDDFWLKQYQNLLEKLPEGLSEAQKNIDPLLAQALLLNGVISCLPFLANLMQCQYNVEKITESELKEAGIVNKSDRIHILDAFQMYRKERIPTVVTPTAPVMPIEEASAPPLETIANLGPECVICMDSTCEVIFVPCGHFCCCSQCPTALADCPMCRTSIERKIRVIS
ncbi:E3 ubiquitin-protein ligase LRSAM1-like [Tribolium madens]|uniref:E3 ubiquitin-protein ligase LRSAM1-like n=1 Tax=Tribolium madens TaxID=41895 RepID=UPI001CF72DE2|nr:E3 ubiquitin-protein ligase LRSAM1-like [Tribolium madens]